MIPPSTDQYTPQASKHGAPRILRVAINAPLNRYFDYLCPADWADADLSPGTRLALPFGRGTTCGVLVEVAGHSEVQASKLKAAVEILDNESLLGEDIVKLLRWAAGYFHHPPGQVFAAALPANLRKPKPLPEPAPEWRAIGQAIERAVDNNDVSAVLSRAPKQRALFDLLCEHGPVSEEDLTSMLPGWRRLMPSLEQKGLAKSALPNRKPNKKHDVASRPGHKLMPAQRQAVDDIGGRLDEFGTTLLFGVTGSGKTEVYLELISRIVAEGKQALVLVPEIGLTPQLIQRFRDRLPGSLAVLHSGLTDSQRLNAWLSARNGEADIVLGTRSAVFTPLANPGLIIVDEEHDSSFKQQEGFRYSARDLAVARAKQLDVPIVLGSATPSLETLHNVGKERYRVCRLPQRPGRAAQPKMRVVDTSAHKTQHGLATPSVLALEKHLNDGGQVLLYLNRRGFAPALFCGECGWIADCRRCDARLTLHRQDQQLRCHHCGYRCGTPAQCPECREELVPVGQGTQRLAEFLEQQFPDAGITRIDRDSTRRKGSLDNKLDDIRSGRARILIGTQMLAKGHDFPELSLVIVVAADQGLFGTDFRASERLAQTIIQVAGRAGRADRPGEVLIQTRFADHPLLLDLIGEGYDGFARDALEERQQAGWPPYCHLAVLRAEASGQSLPIEFLQQARERAEVLGGDTVLLGPAPAQMEKRAGRFRAQLLLQADHRGELHRLLRDWAPSLETLPLARKVRWALDVDPIDMT